MKTFTISGKVWRYPHPNVPESGWYFVYLNKKLSQQIKDTARNLSRRQTDKKKVGFQFVRVKATLGKASWTTALFPTKDGPYLIAIKADVRRKEGTDEGDAVKIACGLV